jgi:chromosome segregation ATPase
MHLDGEDMAIVGGGGTAALGFVLGVVQRYVSPRLDALRERLAKVEADNEKLEKRLLDSEQDAHRLREDLDAKLTAKVTHLHDRTNEVERAQARLEGKLSGSFKVNP